MWRSAAGRDVKAAVVANDDDWDTDPNFVVCLKITTIIFEVII